MNDNIIKQHSAEQYEARKDKDGLNRKNTIVVKKKSKGLLNKIKSLFRKKNK